MKYNLATTPLLLKRSLSPAVAMCLISISTSLVAAEDPVYLSQNTDTDKHHIANEHHSEALSFSSQFNLNTGKAAKIAFFPTENATQSKLLLESYNALQRAIINEDFSVDNLFTFNSQLTWQNVYFSQQYFRISTAKQTPKLNQHILPTTLDSMQYYQAQLATYNKSKTIMATLAYESAQNSDLFGTQQANLEADIAFYNPYKYFSRVNLNYKKSLVGLEMSQFGMGLTFYGDLNLSILSSLSIEDINNNRFPKKMNLSIGISTDL